MCQKVVALGFGKSIDGDWARAKDPNQQMAFTRPDSDSWTEALFTKAIKSCSHLLPEPADVTLRLALLRVDYTSMWLDSVPADSESGISLDVSNDPTLQFFERYHPKGVFAIALGIRVGQFPADPRLDGLKIRGARVGFRETCVTESESGWS